MECLKQFYGGSKNSRTSVYAKIFLTPRNHFIHLPKTSYMGNQGVVIGELNFAIL